MSDDRIEGAARNSLGHVQDAVGGLVGDTRTQAKGKFNEVAGKAQNAYGKVRDQADEALGDVRAQAKDRFNDVAGSVQNAYGKALNQADDVFGDVLVEVQDRAQVVYSELEQYIREKPLMSVGLGVLAGVLLWHMIGGGRKVIYVRK